MDGDKSITATYGTPTPTYTLTVSHTGTGSGTITSSPAGISCASGTCSASFSSGIPVTLSASFASGSTFSGWSGSGCSGTGTCTVTMSSNISVTANFTLNPVGDTTPPTVTSFTIPSTSSSLIVPITAFAATDNVGVTGYLLTETSSTPSPTAPGWTALPPSSYAFATEGTKTLHAWAKDAAGLVSSSLSDSVVITLPDSTPPNVTAFTIPSTSSSLTVPITTFTASDNVGVTGYLLTETSVTPSASASGWTATAPASYTFSSNGTKTLYAWAKDAAGLVSSSLSDGVVITYSPPSGTLHYIRAGASGTANGSDWNNAWTDVPSSLARGDTYYVADGSYSSHLFSTPVSGSTYITVKKATMADHGTDAGWSNSFGDGQAIFADYIQFTSSYWIFDGNGNTTIPSNNTNDYGFKINSPTPTWTGVLRFGGGSSAISYVTVRYAHSYSGYTAKTSNTDAINTKFYWATIAPSHSYIKIQNSFIENSGQDGIQLMSSHHILFERTYFKWLGEKGGHLPDYHGQTIQNMIGAQDVIFRYNVFESCEGEALWSIFGPNGAPARLRFYGNVVYNPYGAYTASAGYNGGIIHYWDEGSTPPDGIYVYNNDIVNIAGTYDQLDGGTNQRARFMLDPAATNAYIYNNLFYDSHYNTAYNWDGHGYHASGGGDTAGGTNEQTALEASIFDDYTGNDFRLASNTAPGLNLATQPWWNGGADSFFGTVDSDVDVYGVTRASWSRGAYEYASGQVCIHESDNSPCDGCVCINELSAFISRWQVNNLDVTLKELMEAIGLWKSGGC